MNALSVGPSYVLAERFDRALKLIRRALSQAELSVVDEFETAWGWREERRGANDQARILLVDCPLLLFEALALDRAAGVFFPLHVLVWAHGDRTQVATANASGLFDLRLPLGAAGPMERLQCRVIAAMESVSFRNSRENHPEGGEE